MIKTTVKGKATIYLGNRINNFIPMGIKVGEMDVFKDKSPAVPKILEENKEIIRKIGEKYCAEVLLTSSAQYYKYITTNTSPNEIEQGSFVTKSRKTVLYAVFGFEPTVLLLTLF